MTQVVTPNFAACLRMSCDSLHLPLLESDSMSQEEKDQVEFLEEDSCWKGRSKARFSCANCAKTWSAYSIIFKFNYDLLRYKGQLYLSVNVKAYGQRCLHCSEMGEILLNPGSCEYLVDQFSEFIESESLVKKEPQTEDLAFTTQDDLDSEVSCNYGTHSPDEKMKLKGQSLWEEMERSTVPSSSIKNTPFGSQIMLRGDVADLDTEDPTDSSSEDNDEDWVSELSGDLSKMKFDDEIMCFD